MLYVAKALRNGEDEEVFCNSAEDALKRVLGVSSKLSEMTYRYRRVPRPVSLSTQAHAELPRDWADHDTVTVDEAVDA